MGLKTVKMDATHHKLYTDWMKETGDKLFSVEEVYNFRASGFRSGFCSGFVWGFIIGGSIPVIVGLLHGIF